MYSVTVVEAVIQAAATHGRNRVAIEDPVSGELSYKRLLVAASIVGTKLMPMAAPDSLAMKLR